MAQPSLNELLKQTSRSFYLTLRVLPRAIRPQIGLAYLLARTSDTIADTEIVPMTKRLEALQKFRERILGTSSAMLNFGELARQQGASAERMLLERVEEALAGLRGLSESDLQRTRKVLDTIIRGQELDLHRFGRTAQDKIIALQNEAELDDYTYRVAGCVGEFWTEMCAAHLFQKPGHQALRAPQFAALGVRFGKGLQLVNILRDLPADLRQGRCYLPIDELARSGLTPADLLGAAREATFRPLYNVYLDRAEAHLAAGWEYTNLVPFANVSLRLACAWPVLIGLATLQRLRVAPVLDPARRVKVSRSQVRGIMMRSVLWYPMPGRWQKLATLSR